jgi:hypothetical protein
MSTCNLALTPRTPRRTGWQRGSTWRLPSLSGEATAGFEGPLNQGLRLSSLRRTVRLRGRVQALHLAARSVPRSGRCGAPGTDFSNQPSDENRTQTDGWHHNDRPVLGTPGHPPSSGRPWRTSRSYVHVRTRETRMQPRERPYGQTAGHECDVRTVSAKVRRRLCELLRGG